jgi:hypothetical protein
MQEIATTSTSEIDERILDDQSSNGACPKLIPFSKALPVILHSLLCFELKK